MSNTSSWKDVLQEFNDKRMKEGGRYIIPKKGSAEYGTIREMMGEKTDAVPLVPDKSITGEKKKQGRHPKADRLNNPRMLRPRSTTR